MEHCIIGRIISTLLLISGLLLSTTNAAKSSDLLVATDKISGSPLIASTVERELSGAATGFAPFADRYPGKRYVSGYGSGSSTFGDYANGYDSHLGNYGARGYYYHPSISRFLGGGYSGYPGYGGYSGYGGYPGYNMHGGGSLGGYNSYPYNSYYYGSRLGLGGGYPSTYSRLGYSSYPSSYYSGGGNYGSNIIGGGLGGGLGTAHSYLPSLGGTYGPYGPAALTGTVY